MRFRVNFVVNRTTLRMQHRAAGQFSKEKLKDVLFPTEKPSSHHSPVHRSEPGKTFKTCNTNKVLLQYCLTSSVPYIPPVPSCFYDSLNCDSALILFLYTCLSVIRLSKLKVNTEQRIAIQHIVDASAKPAPYVVFGPPGTGTIHKCVCECHLMLKYSFY